MSNEMPERHIMLDIETLGVDIDAPVISVGAVVFFPGSLEVSDSKQWNISDIDVQIDLGRKLNYPTVKWWLNQSKEAIDKTFNSENAISTSEMLDQFHMFCLTDGGGNVWGYKNIFIWGNGNTFDNVIMRSLYKTFKKDYPAPYQNDLDLRTIKWLSRNNMPHVDDVGTGHNAVDDAMYQVNLLNAILEKVSI
jgi:exodeoxyribonuclease VIII